jgi:hypothetical protein
MYIIKRSILFLIVSLYTSVTAKEKSDFATALNAVYEKQIDKVSYETLTGVLWEFYQHPIDLNNIPRDELKQIHILSEEQLESFFIIYIKMVCWFLFTSYRQYLD